MKAPFLRLSHFMYHNLQTYIRLCNSNQELINSCKKQAFVQTIYICIYDGLVNHQWNNVLILAQIAAQFFFLLHEEKGW